MRASDLPPLGRLVALALLTRADAESAVIPVQFSPSLALLARDTGLSRASVKRHLNGLESSGWLSRGRHRRAAADHKPTTYRLRVPDAGARPTESLGAQRAKAPRRTEGQGLGSQSRRAGLTESPNQNNTRPKPDQKKQQPTDPYAARGFAEFWNAYPRKVAKRAAATAYKAALKRAGSPEPIVKGAITYRDDPGRTDAYTKHPATWLNGDCWLDERAQGPARPPETDRYDDRSWSSWGGTA